MTSDIPNWYLLVTENWKLNEPNFRIMISIKDQIIRN